MRVTSKAAALAAGTILAATVPVALAAPANAESCTAHRTFVVGGMNDPTAGAYAGDVARIHYSASIWPIGPITYDESVAEGTRNTVAAVTDYAARCPDSGITVKGYSEGARAAGDALVALDATPYADRINGRLYGDPRNTGGIEDTFEGVSAFGITMNGTRPGTDTIHIDEVCNDQPWDRDGICSLPHPLPDLIGFADGVYGYFAGSHMYNLNDK